MPDPSARRKYLRFNHGRFEIRPILEWDPERRRAERITLGQYDRPEEAEAAFLLWLKLLRTIPDAYEARAAMREQLGLPPMLPKFVRRRRSLFIVRLVRAGNVIVLGPFKTSRKAAAAARRWQAEHAGYRVSNACQALTTTPSRRRAALTRYSALAAG